MNDPSKAASDTARPLAPVGVLMVLVVGAYGVIVGCGGKTQESGTNPPATQQPSAAQPAADTGAASGDVMALGAKVYKDRCALCHGPQGKGDGPAAAGLNPKPRNHTNGSYMNARTDEELLAVIRDGKGAMPAWKAVLNQQEIQAVLKHVRSLAK